MKYFLLYKGFLQIFWLFWCNNASAFLSTFDVYLYLTRNINNIEKYDNDIIVISGPGDEIFRSAELQNLPLTSIGLVTPSDNKDFDLILKRLLDFPEPINALVNLNSVIRTRQFLQSYQNMRSHFQQPWKIFIIWNSNYTKYSCTDTADLISDFIDKLRPWTFEANFPDLSSDVYILHNRQNYAIDTIDIYEIYSIRNITTVIQPVIIPSGIGNFLTELSAKATRRSNFRRVEIRGIVPVKNNAAGRDISYNVELDQRTGEYKFVGGYRVEEFMYLRDALNFTPIAVEGAGYVALAPNGSLIGIGKDIVEDRAEVGVPSNEIVPYRLKYLTFLHPTSDQRLFSFFKQPAVSSVREIYSQTFSKGLWLVYFAFWIFFTANAILLAWLWRRSKFELRKFDHEGVGIWDYIFWTLAVVVQQGNSRFKKPEPGSMKFVIIFGLMTSSTLYAAYTGALVSILMTPVIPIKSFADLLDHRFILYAEKFTLQANNLFTDMYGNRSEHPERNPGIDWGTVDLEPDRAISKIVETKSTLVAPRHLFYSFLFERHYPINFICEYISGLPLNIYPPKTGMFVKKGSPLKETLNFRILQMFERGIRQRIETRFKKDTTITCFRQCEEPASQSSLGLSDIFTSVVILAFGLFASVLALIIEKIFRGGSSRKR